MSVWYVAAAVMAGRKTLVAPMKAPRWRLAGRKPEEESGGKPYTQGLLRFNGVVVLAFCALQVLLAHLQLNPHGFGVVSADSDVVYRFVA